MERTDRVRRGARRAGIRTGVTSLVALLLVTLAPTVVQAAHPPSPPGCTTAQVTGSSTGGAKPIPDSSTLVSTIDLPGAVGYVHDVDVNVRITHTYPGDLDIALTSPSGTVVTLTSDNGSANDNVFADTTFDDDAEPSAALPYAGSPKLVTDATYATGVNQATLAPEGALGAFDGEKVAGTWTLTITDDSGSDTGTLAGWSLDIGTVASPPQRLSFATLPNANQPMPNGQYQREIEVGGAGGSIENIEFSLNIDHADDGQLDVALTSPAGTTAILTTDNGAGQNRFRPTRFSDDAATPVTDADFASSVSEAQPEEAMSVFDGENPNGAWIVTVIDDTVDGVTGEYQAARLTVSTGSCPPPVAWPPIDAECGTTGSGVSPATDVPKVIAPSSVVTSTITVPVSSLPLRDVDVIVDIEHPRPLDLDIRLHSPDGTWLTLFVKPVGIKSNYLRGVRFDDDADPDGTLPYSTNDGIMTDTEYRSQVTAHRLTPVDALGELAGETAGGPWMLRVEDTSGTFSGTLHSWSIERKQSTRMPVSAQQSFVGSTGNIFDASKSTFYTYVGGAVFPITDVFVSVSTPHKRPGDLDMVLRSPSGTAVTLTTDNGGSNADQFLSTYFADGAPNSLFGAYSGSVPTGFRPEEPLSAFIGEPANGQWALEVVDDTAGYSEMLNSWTLEVSTGRCSRPPVATDHSYTVVESKAKVVGPAQGLLGGSSDPDGDTLTAEVVAAPANGAVTVNADGGFTYTPVKRRRGPDSFTFRAKDPLGLFSPPMTVSLNVIAPGCSPPGPFPDVANTHVFCKQILWMANDGITTGYSDGTYRPAAAVTRGSMAAFLYRTKFPVAGALPVCSGAGPYPDVPATHAFCPYILWMKQSGVASGGSDGLFHPEQVVTRGSMAAFLYRLKFGAAAPVACEPPGPFPDVASSHPFCSYIAWLEGAGITGGYDDGTFRPGVAVSRGSMAAFIERYVYPPSA